MLKRWTRFLFQGSDRKNKIKHRTENKSNRGTSKTSAGICGSSHSEMRSPHYFRTEQNFKKTDAEQLDNLSATEFIRK